MLLRESQVQPLLLVFEDLHWIDAETQALLDSLVESLPTARLLLLVNYRPEYQHGWGSKTYYTQLRLDPLPPVSADELLQALLGDDPSLAPLKRLLIARTEGNPFFLEESVRTLVETGVLVGEPGAYRLAQALPTLQVPATVQAVLAARIDRLPPEEKRLLQTAAVIGTDVPLPLLQAIAEVPEEALHRGLAHLQAAEFLYETRLFPEREYTFKHALTHEVAYGSLLQERRRVLHARIVEALEALAGDRVAEQVERLAHHALRGEVWDKALTYCRQAGARALARVGLPRGGGVLRAGAQALAHLPEDGETSEQAIDLRLALARRSAARRYGRILALSARGRGPRRGARRSASAGTGAGSFITPFQVHGRPMTAMAAGQQALALATAESAMAPCRSRQPLPRHGLLRPGRLRRAIDCCRQSVAFSTGRGAASASAGLPARRALPRRLARSMASWGCSPRAGLRGGRAPPRRGVGSSREPHDCLMGPRPAVPRPRGPGRRFPLFERAWPSVRTPTSRLFPRDRGGLGDAYALHGRLAEAVPLLDAGDQQRSLQGTVGVRALCGLSAGRGLSAGWPPGGGGNPRRA